MAWRGVRSFGRSSQAKKMIDKASLACQNAGTPFFSERRTRDRPFPPLFHASHDAGTPFLQVKERVRQRGAAGGCAGEGGGRRRGWREQIEGQRHNSSGGMPD